MSRKRSVEGGAISPLIAHASGATVSSGGLEEVFTPHRT